MSAVIPLFPLELVVYPEEILPLHIFEERYKVLIRECYDNQKPFGIVAFMEKGLAPYGTSVEVNTLTKIYKSGEMDVITLGKSVFHLKKFIRQYEDKPYFAGEVEFMEIEKECTLELKENVVRKYMELHDVLGSQVEDPDFYSKPLLSYRVAHSCGMNLTQKLQLLAIASENERLKYILEHITAFIPVTKGMQESKKKIKQNGHFHSRSGKV